MARRLDGLAGTIYAKLQENCKTALVPVFVTIAESAHLTDFRLNNKVIIFSRIIKFVCVTNENVINSML